MKQIKYKENNHHIFEQIKSIMKMNKHEILCKSSPRLINVLFLNHKMLCVIYVCKLCKLLCILMPVNIKHTHTHTLSLIYSFIK